MMKIIIIFVLILSIGALASEDYLAGTLLALLLVGLAIAYNKINKKIVSADYIDDNYEKTVESREKLNRYYSYMDKIQRAEKNNNIDASLKYVSKTIPMLAQFVDDTIDSYGSFDIGTIPAIDVGCKYWAALEDMNNLSLLKNSVEKKEELKKWLPSINKAFIDAELSGKIKGHLLSNPGQRQSTLGKELNVSGRDTTRIVKNLEKLGLVRREIDGKTYKLYVTNA